MKALRPVENEVEVVLTTVAFSKHVVQGVDNKKNTSPAGVRVATLILTILLLSVCVSIPSAVRPGIKRTK